MKRYTFILIVITVGIGLLFVAPKVQKYFEPKALRNLPAKWVQATERDIPKVLAKNKHDIIRTGKQLNVNPNLVFAIYFVESRGDPKAHTKKGAKGCMQTLHSTNVEIGMGKQNSFDCRTSIKQGTTYLVSLHKRYKFTDIYRVIVAYHRGPSKTKVYTDDEVLDEEYLSKVLAVMQRIPPGTF